MSGRPKPRAARFAQPTCPARVAAASGEGPRPVHLRPGVDGALELLALRHWALTDEIEAVDQHSSPCRQLDWRWLGILNQDMIDMADAIALTTMRGAVDWLA